MKHILLTLKLTFHQGPTLITAFHHGPTLINAYFQAATNLSDQDSSVSKEACALQAKLLQTQI